MIYGSPTLHIDDDTTDRIGIRTLIISQLWQPTTWPVTDLLQIDAQKPPVPAVPGGVLLIGEQTRPVRGALKTSWTFEGINGDGQDVTFKDRTNSLDYSFEPGFAQQSIIQHPTFDAMASKYNGQVQDGQVTWPQWLAAGTSSGAVVGTAAGTPNPLFGHTDYYSMQGTYSFRYASLTLGAALQGVGQIAGSLPGQPPVFPGRNWLKAPSPWQRRGPVLEITEIYWLSDVGLWPDAIYGPSAMTAASGNGAGSGLTTGSLSTGSL